MLDMLKFLFLLHCKISFKKCIAILLRFYEEGDAARLVIPPHSEFRKNIDWIDDNFPREVTRNDNSMLLDENFSSAACVHLSTSNKYCFMK